VVANVAEEEQKVVEEKEEKRDRKNQINLRDLGYALSEIEFVKKVIKANGLHRGLRDKLQDQEEGHTFQEPMGDPITDEQLGELRRRYGPRNSFPNNRQGGYQGNRQGGYQGNRQGGYQGNRQGGYQANRQGQYQGGRRFVNSAKGESAGSTEGVESRE